MEKTNRKIKWIAGLLCVLTLISALPLFPLDVAAADATAYRWGYTGTDIVAGTTDTIADAGTLDVAWIRGGYYEAKNGVKDIKASKNHSYTEGIIVYPGMKIWWTDPTDPAGHGEVAAVKFWTDATLTKTIYETRGVQDYFGSREGTAEGQGYPFAVGGSESATGNGMVMQNKINAAGSICYTYWNFTNQTMYVTLSYKGTDAVPIFYSAGEPQLMGEDDVPLPRKLLSDVTWTNNKQLVKNGSSYTESSSAGYLLSSVITVKPKQSIALFSDRTLNGQTGADSQIVETNPTYTFAAFSGSSTSTSNFISGASVDISSAKISKGPISNTGVVVYQYTNNTANTVYVRVSYCCTEQRSGNFKASNVYLYEDFTTYKPIRTNTQVVAGYFSSQGATTVNTTVKTPPAPSKTQDGVFFGWQVEYTKSSAAVKEFYPPETVLNITTTSTTSKISSEIKMTPVYLDALPFTYGGASIRTLIPTGLQFKLYFRKSDFDKMVSEANATKGSLSIGAFAVPESHMNYLLSNKTNCINLTGKSNTTALKNASLSDAEKNKISASFTKEWFDANESAIRAYAESVTKQPYTAPMYLDGRTEGSYVTLEKIDGVDYCVAYYTLADSYIYFDMDFAARAYLAIQYEYYDANGKQSYKYSDPLYGEFKTTNIRNTEEVMLATLRDRTPDYAGIQYFTDSLTEMENDVKAGGVKFGTWKFSKEGKVYESFTYYDPQAGKNVTLYTRRFSGATLAEFGRIIKGTAYDPANH